MGEAEWLAALNENDDIMWKIIGDIYDAVKTEEEKDAGIRRMGRRPARQGTSMDEVYATVFPQQYSTDPFGITFRRLMLGRSQTQVAMKIPCNQSTISKYLSGQRMPDVTTMERIAAAVKVPPHYFTEYRAMMLGQLITQILTEQPTMGITAMKRLRARRGFSETSAV